MNFSELGGGIPAVQAYSCTQQEFHGRSCDVSLGEGRLDKM